MAEKKDTRKRSVDEQRAEDEATGELDDGRIMLTNGSGEVKKVTAEEWGNEAFQADLLKKGWREVGAGESEEG